MDLFTPSTVRSAVERLLSARLALRERTPAEIFSALDRTVGAWLEADSAWLRRAEAEVSRASGFSPEMVRYALPTVLAPLRAPALERLVVEELGGLEFLSRPPELPPRLVLHILPGNLPGLAAAPVCLSLATGVAALLKPGSGDLAFPRLFLESLATLDPDLAACVEVRYWKGGSPEPEKELFALVDAVDAAGSDEAMEDLAKRYSGTLVVRGSRLSFAYVARPSWQDPLLRGRAFRALVEDTVVWDQLGCLSPQVVFFEGAAFGDLVRLAEELGEEFELARKRLPPKRLSLEEESRIVRFRQEAEWREIRGEEKRLLGGEDLSWTLLLEKGPNFAPTCLHRTLRLQTVQGTEELEEPMRRAHSRLEAVGVAAAPDDFPAVADVFRKARLPRVVPLGEMQRPGLDWKPGGIPRVREWFAPRDGEKSDRGTRVTPRALP
ncbi:MAG: acyl-CoA reductase [Candidatus Binatia bacterium]|nr:MAG: acyl-CoA reductase [Candidatus Binatia bacterium]